MIFENYIDKAIDALKASSGIPTPNFNVGYRPGIGGERNAPITLIQGDNVPWDTVYTMSEGGITEAFEDDWITWDGSGPVYINKIGWYQAFYLINLTPSPTSAFIYSFSAGPNGPHDNVIYPGGSRIICSTIDYFFPGSSLNLNTYGPTIENPVTITYAVNILTPLFS